MTWRATNTLWAFAPGDVRGVGLPRIRLTRRRRWRHHSRGRVVVENLHSADVESMNVENQHSADVESTNVENLHSADVESTNQPPITRFCTRMGTHFVLNGQVSHAPMSVECLFSVTRLRGAPVPRAAHHAPHPARRHVAELRLHALRAHRQGGQRPGPGGGGCRLLPAMSSH